jgi:adenylate cyclase
MGKQTLENIVGPLQVYRVRSHPVAVGAPEAQPSFARIARQAIDRRVAVRQMSGDPEQEYFADGMVEEIITALFRIRWLFVIARNSTFTYKG